MSPGPWRADRPPRGLLGEPPTPARASKLDLLAGLARAWKGWLVIAALVLLGWVGLALGANLPADPRLAPTSESSGEGEAAQADVASVAVGKECLQVEVADTEAERREGLRGRADLGGLDGMLFVNDAPVTDGYTMSGMRFPLTIAFFDGAGRLVDRQDAEPCASSVTDCPVYEPGGAYVKVLEVARGQLPAGALGECQATLPVTPSS